MNADQIRELQRHGVQFGSHSLTHLSLPELNTADLRREVEDSKHRLEDLLGEAVNTFAYPFGEANRRVRAAVIEAGYRVAFTAANGLNLWQDPFAMMRIDINERIAPSTYRWRLRSGVSPWQSLKQELMPLFKMIRASCARRSRRHGRSEEHRSPLSG